MKYKCRIKGQTLFCFQVDLNTMDNGRCVRDFVWASSQITANMICANSAEDKDVCQGDSEGPMMANEGAYYSVIGKLTLLVILLSGLIIIFRSRIFPSRKRGHFLVQLQECSERFFSDHRATGLHKQTHVWRNL